MDLVYYRAWLGHRVWLRGVSPSSPTRYAEVVRVYEAMDHVSVDVVLRLQDKSVTVVRASEKGRGWDLI
jgi:hypothetical protein